MRLPRSVSKLIENFERLPGIGPKTAARLTFYLLNIPQHLLDEFGEALKNLRLQTVTCSTCFNVAEADPCPICADVNRDKSIICVVEQPLDALALEKSGKYNGVYHVLGGVIDPLNNIGPDEIRIKQLLNRISGNQPSKSVAISEVILAIDPDMEGEATAMFISKELQRIKAARLPSLARPPAEPSEAARGSEATGGQAKQQRFKVTRLGQGLPTGADIEYADETTLEKAMEGRKVYE